MSLKRGLIFGVYLVFCCLIAIPLMGSSCDDDQVNCVLADGTVIKVNNGPTGRATCLGLQQGALNAFNSRRPSASSSGP